ncbi:Gfo/Idh/MocA family protein [Veronia pacifica]|uniref:Gfo/Idh/MocA-like oxidoreductase N-terminal domain-containing protein n=1 Tax=Veronia pacifica TaxID=1080227 RepID=A0A1C3EKU3_9GAMM|nr:Gfo/Idh/MocA family oxidoreductase [Veronia pacifica]ODA33849.1 hypothetical protein A8L45_08455 [Veronia pacifica]
MTISVGIIGFGTIGRKIFHNLTNHSSFSVKCIYDSRPESDIGVTEGTELILTVDDMFTRQDIDIIYIGTPPASHLEYCRKAIEAGKIIWCEKPLATNIKEAEEVVALAESKQIPAFVNLPGATDSTTDTLELLLSDISPQSVKEIDMQIHFSQWPREWQKGASSWLSRKEEGGFFREVATQFLFLQQRIFGEMHLTQTDVVYPDDISSETAVTAKYESLGVPVSIEASSDVVKDDYLQWTLVSSKKSIRLINWRQIEINDGSGWKEVHVSGENSQLEHIIKLVNGEPNKLATLREALDVQKLVEATLKETTDELPPFLNSL